MGQSIQVTTEDVRALSDNCIQTGGNVASELNGLLGRVNAVVSGSWVSSASGAFDGYFKEFHTGWMKVQDALQGISQQLRGAADAYEQTEQGIAGGFGGRG
jgi:WXG100 family type VII secretion target